MRRQAIDQGWEFKQTTRNNNGAASDEYLPVSQFPTVVQLDLLHHGLILDPYIGQNEPHNLWVGESDWEYRTEFTVEPVQEGEKAEFVFEGLDTWVNVYLDGTHVLTAKDMFLIHRVDVTDILKANIGKTIALQLKFESNQRKAKEERDRIGSNGMDSGINFGGSERLFLRKAQYHWGWDWGPVVNCQGPYRGIFLETYRSRIEDLQVQPDVNVDLKSAQIKLFGTVQGASDSVDLCITAPDGSQIDTCVNVNTDGEYSTQVTVHNPKLWYPFMYGEQPLYRVTATIAGHNLSKDFGIRRLRLIQKEFAAKEEKGTSFVFEVNNIEIFCGGSNWIPGDTMPPRMTEKRYKEWISWAKRGNHSMIRIWGGGYVPDEPFYAACDREGILIWSDFQFACGNYPAKGDYLENVKAEIRQQVKLTNHHPSLVCYNGNNEDYLLADRRGWDWDRSNNDGPWDDTNFPARLIYEKVMPHICQELAPHVPYWRSSPYGGYYANDLTIGNTHCWDIWNEEALPYQQYVDFASRFITEFGYESPPNIRTIKYGIPDESEQHCQSATFDCHDKYKGNGRRYAMYMSENIRYKMDPLDDYVYCTQWMQAEAMSYAVTLWRRRFQGPGKNYTAGAVIWQLNDLWPGQSWALVDMFYNPKLAWFSARRAMAPRFVGIQRKATDTPNYVLRSYVPNKRAFDVWAVTTSLKEEQFTLVVKAFNVQAGSAVKLDIAQEQTVTLPPNRASELLHAVSIPDDKNTVLAAYLYQGGVQVARFINWPEPFKFLTFAESPKVTVDVSSKPGHVSVSSSAPLKGVYLHTSDDQPEADWGENYVDLVPGETITVPVSGLNGRKVLLKWMCHWEMSPEIEYK